VSLAATPSSVALGLIETPDPRTLDVSLTARPHHKKVITK